MFEVVAEVDGAAGAGDRPTNGCDSVGGHWCDCPVRPEAAQLAVEGVSVLCRRARVQNHPVMLAPGATSMAQLPRLGTGYPTEVNGAKYSATWRFPKYWAQPSGVAPKSASSASVSAPLSTRQRTAWRAPAPAARCKALRGPGAPTAKPSSRSETKRPTGRRRQQPSPPPGDRRWHDRARLDRRREPRDGRGRIWHRQPDRSRSSYPSQPSMPRRDRAASLVLRRDG